jgi:membrane protease YdiL (CAAX protease family)
MIRAFRRHPLASYFTLAFGLSWGAVSIIIFPGALPAEPSEANRLFPFVYLAMLVGPTTAALVTTAGESGIAGLREFRRRLVAWRLSPAWYGLALLTAPLALVLTRFVLSRFATASVGFAGEGPATMSGPIKAGSQAGFLAMAVAVGLGAGFFEELGWSGFALPRLLRRRGPGIAGVTLGFFWGAWHFLAVYWGSASAFGSASVRAFMIVALFSFLPAYRVLMARVYEYTHSLPVMIVMHASLTTSMLALGPPLAGNALIVYDLVFAGVLWGFALAMPARRAEDPGSESGVPVRL